MSRSATSSERWPRALPVLWLAAVLAASPAAAQTISQEEALRLAFPPGAQVERRTAYLEPVQLAAARKLAGPDVEVKQRVVTYYVAARNGRPEAVAYFDSHRVRTLPEVVMVVVDAESRVQRVEVLKFAEPPEYRAPERWLALLRGKPLGAGLSLRRDLVNLTGATLTAEAVVRATRRVLALHAIIRPLETGP